MNVKLSFKMELHKWVKHFIWNYSNFLTSRPSKFGIKLGLLAGTAYYISDQGVWRDSDTTLILYNKIKTNCSPYTQMVTNQIPYEFPSLPSTGEVSYITKYYWNRGVIASFTFLANVPSYISDYTSKGFDAILDNTEVKSLLAEETDSQN